MFIKMNQKESLFEKNTVLDTPRSMLVVVCTTEEEEEEARMQQNMNNQKSENLRI